MFSYVCTACGKKTPADTLAPVCGCGGLFELDFKSPKWDDAKIDQKCWSIFRYRDFMAVDGDAWQSVSLGEGMTPLVELEPGLYVKVDYAMPTLSFKDRGAATLVAHMKAIGVKSCVQRLERQCRQRRSSLLRQSRHSVRNLCSGRNEPQEDHHD